MELRKKTEKTFCRGEIRAGWPMRKNLGEIWRGFVRNYPIWKNLELPVFIWILSWKPSQTTNMIQPIIRKLIRLLAMEIPWKYSVKRHTKKGFESWWMPYSTTVEENLLHGWMYWKMERIPAMRIGSWLKTGSRSERERIPETDVFILSHFPMGCQSWILIMKKWFNISARSAKTGFGIMI